MTLKCLFAWRAVVVVVVVVAMADAFAFAWFTSTNGCHDGSLATLRTPMKAVIRCDCGTVQVLKLVDVKRPVPAADEVLVKVPAGAIDPRDRAGGVNRGPGRATASAQPTDGVCARVGSAHRAVSPRSPHARRATTSCGVLRRH